METGRNGKERAVVYLRVSREDEDPENQRFVTESFCRERELDCIFFPPEIGVARTEDPFTRPVLSQILKFMEINGVRILVTESVDRLIAEPEYWRTFLSHCADRGIKLLFVRESPIADAIEQAVRTVQELRSKSDSAVYRVVLDTLTDNLMRLIQLYFDVKVAVSKEYVEDVRRKVKRTVERLKSEGKIYAKPSLYHFYALYLSGKKNFSELTREEIDFGAKVFYQKYVKPVETGIPIARVYRTFIEQEQGFLNFLSERRKGKNTYTSYYSFWRAVRRLLS